GGGLGHGEPARLHDLGRLAGFDRTAGDHADARVQHRAHPQRGHHEHRLGHGLPGGHLRHRRHDHGAEVIDRPSHLLPTRRPRPAAGTATVAVAVIAILAMGAGAALAFWGISDSSNPARVAADALQAGPTPTGSAANQSVTLSWTAGSTAGGRAP